MNVVAQDTTRAQIEVQTTISTTQDEQIKPQMANITSWRTYFLL